MSCHSVSSIAGSVFQLGGDDTFEYLKNTLQTGVTRSVNLEVDRDRTIGFMGENARVYATPMMVRDIDTSFVKREMLKAIHSLAGNVGADVIAEGIERVEELDTLLELGIPYGQGFLFARPSTSFNEVASVRRHAVADPGAALHRRRGG